MIKKPHVLLINPYIYDFAAYDLWIKPLGLLYLAAVLEESGFHVHWLDAMDRNDPDVLNLQGLHSAKSRPYGDGFFYKEQVDKPMEFRSVRRHYSRYGMPPQIMRARLEAISRENEISAILVTSGMTYWYCGVFESIAMCRELFPQAKILLGGIYATLFTDHARRYSGADMVLQGEGERSILKIMSQWFPDSEKKKYMGYDDYPLPAYHLYPKLEYAAMMTSRGCPYTCSFCATHEFTEQFTRRSPEHVIREISVYAERGIRNITFYDDALFVNAEKHIKPILRAVIQKDLGLNFHTPNGLFAKLIDAELSELLVRSGFRTIRLSFETKNPDRQKQMGKVNDTDLARALMHLEKAGFDRKDVVVYLIMGLPDQLPYEVEQSIDYVHSLGAKASLSSFSPIPNTGEWTIATTRYNFPVDEPLLTNKSIYPLKNENFSEDDFDRLKEHVMIRNRSLVQTEPSISDYNIYA